ncbi:MAG: nuclear transport factor 2 family protein [Hyphomicrobium sp.]
MRSDPEGILEAAITAIALEDVESAAAFFDENAEFAILIPVGVLPFGGTFKGRKSFTKRLAMIAGEFHVARFSARTILPCDEGLRTQIDYSFHHRSSGQAIDGVMRVVARIRDGKIVRWHEFQDTERVEAFMRLVNSTKRPRE